MNENLKYNIFSEGTRPTLMEVMDRREERVYQIRQILNSENCVLCLKLNIPGEVKNNKWIMKVFEDAVNKVDNKLLEIGAVIENRFIQNLKTGPEYIVGISSIKAEEIKRYMIEIEESTSIGRLYDIDVECKMGSISRKDVGSEERKCFLCDKPSKICSSSRSHSVDEMLAFISELIFKNFNNLTKI